MDFSRSVTARATWSICWSVNTIVWLTEIERRGESTHASGLLRHDAHAQSRRRSWGPPILRSRKIIAGVHIPAGIRHVVVQFAVGSVGEPVRIVTSSGLVLSEQHFELRGVKIAINGVERRLIGRVAVTQPGVMVIKIL